MGPLTGQSSTVGTAHQPIVDCGNAPHGFPVWANPQRYKVGLSIASCVLFVTSIIPSVVLRTRGCPSCPFPSLLPPGCPLRAPTLFALYLSAIFVVWSLAIPVAYASCQVVPCAFPQDVVFCIRQCALVCLAFVWTGSMPLIVWYADTFVVNGHSR